jgi:antitoxin PrlF
MTTTLTSKGQVTIPKAVRAAMKLEPGSSVEFAVNDEGDVVLRPVSPAPKSGNKKDRFEAARGRAQGSWRTDDLMALLRPKI